MRPVSGTTFPWSLPRSDPSLAHEFVGEQPSLPSVTMLLLKTIVPLGLPFICILGSGWRWNESVRAILSGPPPPPPRRSSKSISEADLHCFKRRWLLGDSDPGELGELIVWCIDVVTPVLALSLSLTLFNLRSPFHAPQVQRFAQALWWSPQSSGGSPLEAPQRTPTIKLSVAQILRSSSDG